MSFGKRGAAQAPAAPKPRVTGPDVAALGFDPSDPGDAEETMSPMLRQAAWIGFGVILAFAIVSVSTFLPKAIGSAVAPTSEAVVWSTILPAPHKERTFTEQRLADACLQLRGAATATSGDVESVFAQSLGRTSAAQVAAAGEYFVCALETAPERFCDPGETAKLVTGLGTFLRYRASILKRAEQERRQGERSGEPADNADGDDANLILDRLALTMRGPIEAGYLQASAMMSLAETDIGPSVAAYATLEVTEKPCQ